MRSHHRIGQGSWVWALFGAPLILVLTIPIAALIAKASPSEVLRQLRSEEAVAAILVSLKTTSVSIACLVLFGTPLAYAIGRSRSRLRSVADGLLSLPAVLPPAVAGIALLLAFGRSGLFGPFLGRLGIQIPFTAGAVVLAQVFVAAPFYVRPSIAAFSQLDSVLAEAAALDGAGPFQIFSRFAVPIARTSLVAAASVGWARALGEFGATILFAGSRFGVTRSMPLAIYLGYESDFDQAVALAVVLLMVAVVVLIVGLALSRRSPS